MKSRKNLLLGLALVGGTAFGAVTVFAANSFGNTIKAGAASAYDCASLHWGMNDTTLQGQANLGASASGTGTFTDVTKLHATADNITVTQFVVSGKDIYTDGKGIKFSTGKANSTLAITFNKPVIGCDIYAVAWSTDTASVKVNGGASRAIASSSTIAGTGTVTATYTKYSFDFDSSNTLTIAATKRIVIGDIALRLPKAN